MNNYLVQELLSIILTSDLSVVNWELQEWKTTKYNTIIMLWINFRNKDYSVTRLCTDQRTYQIQQTILDTVFRDGKVFMP